MHLKPVQNSIFSQKSVVNIGILPQTPITGFALDPTGSMAPDPHSCTRTSNDLGGSEWRRVFATTVDILPYFWFCTAHLWNVRISNGRRRDILISSQLRAVLCVCVLGLLNASRSNPLIWVGRHEGLQLLRSVVWSWTMASQMWHRAQSVRAIETCTRTMTCI